MLIVDELPCVAILESPARPRWVAHDADPAISHVMAALIAFDIAANSSTSLLGRRHRSEIMFGVLIVILRPDYIAGLNLSLG
jgi:hypothetical protein